MKKLIKWLLGLVAFLAVLVVLAVVLLPMFFDPNEHKPHIQQLAADSIGREVTLNGPIEWSVFPWVAINLNDVTVANEAGFKGDYLAEVKQVAVRVKLLPLLKKQIQVGQVELQQPNINLQVAKSGKSNWQSIIEHMDQGSSDPAANSGSTDLEIRGISISDGSLSYADGGADLRVQMNDLNFDSEAIKAGSPTQMSLSAEIEIAAQNFKGQLQTAWNAKGITSDSGMVLNFNAMKFQGQADTVPLVLSTSGQVKLDLAQDSLAVDDMELSYGSMNLNTTVSGKNISTNMALSGQLNMTEFSLAELLTELGSPLDNQANNDLSGQMQWSLVGDRLQLNNIDMNLDESTIKGQIDIKQLSQLKGQFDLNINQLNLDQYLPNDEAPSTASTDSVAMDMGQMSGQIKMNKLIAAGVNLEDITLKIRTQGKNLTIEPLQAGFYQGLIKTELQLQPDNRTEKLKITHSMQDFQAGNLLTDLMGTDYLTGLGQLNADVKIDEPFAERPFKTANGSVSYRLTDGDIVGIDIFQIMQQSLSLLNKTDAAQSNSDLKTAFGLMEIQADIKQGVLKTNTLKLTSPYFDLKGQVEIDLDQQTIKGTIQPMLINIPEGVLDQNFEKLLNLRIPVSLKGSLLEPEISIDLAKLILATQKDKIDKKKEELKNDLFDKLLGSNKKDKSSEQAADPNNQGPGNAQPELTEKQKKRAKKDKMKRDLLEGLFKSKKDKPKATEEGEDTGGNQ
ncbi:hypothetical protein MNBD_GAMMA02-1423 [hydrothermal vent metagenome]|uniref:AsmA domain-containing protein n=1 Tax=hydrothermal vent metagenome TaxID=652676 RepID=A0A3B0WJF6_9ZZZZ